MKKLILEIKRGLIIASLCGIIFTVITMLLNFASLSTNSILVEERIRDAFVERSLVPVDYLPYDEKIGSHQLNDCLVFYMAWKRTDNRIADAITPHFVKGDNDDGLCSRLQNDVSTEGDFGRRYFYHRYLHGHRTLSLLLLKNFSIKEVRVFLYRLTIVLLGAAAIAGVVVAGFRSRRAQISNFEWIIAVGRRPESHISIASIILLHFFGLEYFGMSIAYAPSVWVLGFFLLFWIFWDPLEMSAFTLYVITAIFGCLTAYFELLNGATPLGLSSIIFILGIWGFYHQTQVALNNRIVVCTVVYGFSVAMMFILKLSLAEVVFEGSIFVDFFESLIRRMHGSATGDGREVEYSLVSIAKGLYWYVGYIGIPHEKFALLTLSGVTVGALIAGIWLIMKAEGSQQYLSLAAIAGSAAVIALWYLAFQQHTVIHAFFMVRILVWPLVVMVSLIIFSITFRVRADQEKPF